MKLTTWARILDECIDALEEEYSGEEMLLATICASAITDTLKQRKACDEYSRSDIEYVVGCLDRFYELEMFEKIADDVKMDLVSAVWFDGGKIKWIDWMRWHEVKCFRACLRERGVNKNEEIL